MKAGIRREPTPGKAPWTQKRRTKREMNPIGSDETEQLRVARARCEVLLEEWRSANSIGIGARNAESLSTAICRARTRAALALMELGRRLLPAAEAAQRMTPVRHSDISC
jgi:hypothetical protein